MAKRTMHMFGDNVIDFEGDLSSELTGGASMTTEFLTLPVETGIHITDTKTSNPLDYYCKIDFSDKKMTLLNDHSVRIPVNEKYNLDGIIMTMPSDAALERWMEDEHITNFINVSLNKKSGGGGAHNSAHSAQVYLNSSPNLPLEIRLVVPYKSGFIAKSLPEGLHYDSIVSDDNDFVTSNLNFKGGYGEKLTFRGRSSNPLKYNIDTKKIKSRDIIAVNSIKDPTYIGELVKILDSTPETEFYLAATDSMIAKLGKEDVFKLALKADLLVTNNSEFDMLTGKTVRTDEELADALLSMQTERRTKYGKNSTIAITYGEIGSVICDSHLNIYFQPTATSSRTTPYSKAISIVNTNGCGDAYFAMMAVGHAVGYGSSIKLNYANAAGHLCAFKPTATDPSLFTNADIENYRRDFGNAPIYCYNRQNKRFE